MSDGSVNTERDHPNVEVDYGGGGSGQGIKGILDRTIDFAGSDAPMSKSEIDRAGGPDAVVEIPSCAGGVVPAYNLPNVKGMKFTGEVLANITWARSRNGTIQKSRN